MGFSEEACITKYAGEMDVYVSKFKPMKNTLSGKQDRTLMKMIVHKGTDSVVGVHMVGEDAAEIMQVRSSVMCAVAHALSSVSARGTLSGSDHLAWA